MKNAILFIFLSIIAAYTTVKLTTNNTIAAHTKEPVFERVMRTGTLRCGYFIMDSLLKKDLQTGQMSGPAYDITMTLAKNLSLKVEWVQEVGFASIGHDLKNNRYDMLCTPVVLNSPRARVVDASRILFYQPLTIWLHKDDHRLSTQDTSWLNNQDTKFISIDGTGFPTIIQSFYPSAHITSLPELTPINDMFLEIKGRKVDVLLMTHYNAVAFAEKNNQVIKQYTNTVVNYPAYQFFFAQNNYQMVQLINNGLQDMFDNGTINSILEKHDPEHIFYKRVNP